MTFNIFSKEVILAIAVSGIAYIIGIFTKHRLSYRNLPGPPHSFFWGHLKAMGEYSQKFPHGAYIHNLLNQMKVDYDLPSVFYLDLWPLGPQLMFCTSPETCAISTTANVFDMPSVVTEFFRGTIGTKFIEATNGPLWKHLHSLLAPGLTPAAVKGYHSVIVREATALHRRFRELASEDEVADLRVEIGWYPFQVVAEVFFGETLSADVFQAALKSVELQTATNATRNPLETRRLRKKHLGYWKIIEGAIETKINTRFADLQSREVVPAKADATNILDRMLLSNVQARQALNHETIRLIVENANGFVIAGYGTTADTSSYIFMLLAAFPETLEKLREEHDRVFDRDFDTTVKMLEGNSNLTKELTYTTAVINETLRMFPVGASVRTPPPGVTTITSNGKVYPIKGDVGIASQLMHYDPKYFDEPKKFKPERFLEDSPAINRNAYRPFERGLRSCMGQTLAMDEMKIMLLLVARWFDFTLEDHEPAEKPLASFTDLDTKIGKHAFQSWAFTAGPVGPVNMRVSAAKR